MAGDLLALAEGYAANDRQATRGEDALQLLRGLWPVLAHAVVNAKASERVAEEEARHTAG